MDRKVCSRCGVECSIDFFYKDNRTKDGLQGACKDCQRRSSNDYKRRNREKMNEYGRMWYQGNKGKYAEWCRSWQDNNKEKYLENQRRWRKRNPDKVKAIWEKHYKKNREAINEKNQRWWADNPEYMQEWKNKNRERVNENHARRKAIIRNATVEKVDYEVILQEYNSICYICGENIARDDLHFDHVIPLARGGEHSADNIRPTHAACNMWKKARMPEEIGVSI